MNAKPGVGQRAWVVGLACVSVLLTGAMGCHGGGEVAVDLSVDASPVDAAGDAAPPDLGSCGSALAPSTDFRLVVTVADPAVLLSLGAAGPMAATLRVTSCSAGPMNYEIDDDPGFRRPIFTQATSAGYLDVDALATGLYPGPRYWVRVTPASGPAHVVALRYLPSTPVSGDLTYAYLQSAWTSMHATTTPAQPLSLYGGMSWDATTHTWSAVDWDDSKPGVLGDWAYASNNGYYLSEFDHGAIEMGLSCNDGGLLDELAQYYVAYAARLRKVSDLRAAVSQYTPNLWVNYLDTIAYGPGSDDIVTLPFILPESCGAAAYKTSCNNTTMICDCGCVHDPYTNTCVSRPCKLDGATMICNGLALTENFLSEGQTEYPIARLLRVISTLPASERTPAMQQLAATWTPVLVDTALRFFYDDRGLGGQNEVAWLQSTIANHWTGANAAPPTYPYALEDVHLWLTMITAELLGASVNDPTLVPVADADAQALTQVVQQFTAALATYEANDFPSTRDWSGATVGSRSYFDGDFARDKYPDDQYSGYTGATYPTADGGAPGPEFSPTASWDISHFVRFPQFLRALYDNRVATGTTFPTTADVAAVLRQRAYVDFEGDLTLPDFRNFFDGSDGWFRIGYDAPGTGYPPSTQPCGTGGHSCFMPPALTGWPLIQYFLPDEVRLEAALTALADSTDAQTVVPFRSAHYDSSYGGVGSFAMHDPATGAPTTPPWVFAVESAMAPRVAGCPLP